MENNKLKKLSRRDLLEILIEQNKKIEALEKELEEKDRLLQERRIMIDNSGSIAEAALRLNGVFSAAEEACRQYMENIKLQGEKQKREAARREKASKEECERLLKEARESAEKVKLR